MTGKEFLHANAAKGLQDVATLLDEIVELRAKIEALEKQLKPKKK